MVIRSKQYYSNHFFKNGIMKRINKVSEMYLDSSTGIITDNNGKSYTIEEAKKFLNDCLFSNNNNGTNINMNVSLSKLAFDFNFDLAAYNNYLNS